MSFSSNSNRIFTFEEIGRIAEFWGGPGVEYRIEPIGVWMAPKGGMFEFVGNSVLEDLWSELVRTSPVCQNGACVADRWGSSVWCDFHSGCDVPYVSALHG